MLGVGGRPRVSVLIGDSSRMGSQLLADAVKRDRRLVVVKSTCSSEELLQAVASSRIDVSLISANLEENPPKALQIMQEMSGSHPEVKTVMLLDCSSREQVIQAFRAGARGVLCRSQSIKALCKCIRGVHAGQIWANSNELSFVLEALASSSLLHFDERGNMELLSKRQHDVVRCVAEGLTNREIAQRLKLSEHTVKNYLIIIFERLGVSNRVELLFRVFAPNLPTRLSNGTLEQDRFTHDASPAFVVCREAAEQGLPAAQFRLAKMYGAGEGVPLDKISAYTWLWLAEKTNSKVLAECRIARAQLAAKMDKDEISQAEQRAVEWVKRTTRAATPLPEHLQSRERDCTAVGTSRL